MYQQIQTPAQLGNAIRTTRKNLQLTQPQLALAAGVGVRFIVELEAGKPTVRLEHTLRVLDALGLDLFVLEGMPTNIQKISDEALNLPIEERAQLIQRLVLSLESPSEQEVCSGQLIPDTFLSFSSAATGASPRLKA